MNFTGYPMQGKKPNSSVYVFCIQAANALFEYKNQIMHQPLLLQFASKVIADLYAINAKKGLVCLTFIDVNTGHEFYIYVELDSDIVGEIKERLNVV